MFLKYPSIIGENDKKSVDFYLEKFPALVDQEMIVTEKLHGSNVSLYVNADGYKIYSRNEEITDKKFHGIQEIVKQHMSEEWFLNILHYTKPHVNFNIIDEDGDFVRSIRLYGEIIGKGVNKGVYYGEEKQIRWFDLEVNGKSISPKSTRLYIPEHRYVPVISILPNLDATLGYGFVAPSRLTPEGYEKQNIAEGIVIRPYYFNYEVPRVQEDGTVGRSRFALKIRNDAFHEACRAKREPLADNLLEWQARFAEFITVNRALNMFSKAPLPESLSKAKAMIPLLVADAKEDFLKAYPTELDAFEKGEHKSIFNAGSKPLNVIVEAYNSLI